MPWDANEIAELVVEKGDYLLAVKEKQGKFYEDLVGLFSGAQEVDYFDVEH